MQHVRARARSASTVRLASLARTASCFFVQAASSETRLLLDRMGNCVCHAPRHGGVAGATTGTGGGGGEPVVWAAERGETRGEERRKKSVKVTVRISKSRLQKLMASGAAGGGGEGMTMTLGNVLAEIVSAGEVVVVDGGHRRLRRRRWEPALESVPEAMESS